MSQPTYGSHGPKPPVPTSPKPNFYRSIPNDPSRGKASSSSSQAHDSHPEVKLVHVPPTTNNLNAAERADLIRKSRKLAQVFGQTPDAMSVSPRQNEPPTRNFLSSYPSPNSKHHRPAASFSVESESASSSRKHSKQDSRPSLRSSISSGSGRRHSAPLSPFDVSSLSHLLSDPEYESNVARGNASAHSTLWEGGDYPERSQRRGDRSHSREMLDSDSFIDLSDEERSDHAHASSSRRTPKSPHSYSSSPPWPPSPTSFDTLTPQEQAEEERRRKREKLAKLHRFLGSRVPASLVLGIDEPALPEPAEPASSTSSSGENEARAWRKLRRRSSSAAELKGAWIDRVKEDLDEREKAINVRRAIKMEKVSPGAFPLWWCLRSLLSWVERQTDRCFAFLLL